MFVLKDKNKFIFKYITSNFRTLIMRIIIKIIIKQQLLSLDSYDDGSKQAGEDYKNFTYKCIDQKHILNANITKLKLMMRRLIIGSYITTTGKLSA